MEISIYRFFINVLFVGYHLIKYQTFIIKLNNLKKYRSQSLSASPSIKHFLCITKYNLHVKTYWVNKANIDYRQTFFMAVVIMVYRSVMVNVNLFIWCVKISCNALQNSGQKHLLLYSAVDIHLLLTLIYYTGW